MPDTAPARVLVVDDVEHLRRLVQMWIKDDDRFEWVGEAVDGESGLEAVATLSPDVVLLDVEMPGISGLEVLERVRAEHPELVVVLYTSDPNVREDGIERGAHAVFVKGDPITSILDCIAELARS